MQSRGVRLKQGPVVATPAAQTVPQPGAAVEITDSPRIKVVRLRTMLGLAMKIGRTEERADFRQVGAVQIWFGSAEQYGPDLAMLSVTISEAKHRDVIRFTQMVNARENNRLDDRARFNSSLAEYMELGDVIGGVGDASGVDFEPGVQLCWEPRNPTGTLAPFPQRG